MVSATLYFVRRKTIGRLQDLRQSVEMHRKIYSAVRLRSEENEKAAMSEHLICAEQDIVSQDPAFERET
jgi:DNA-binding FadR family transcriptional regulator